MFAICELLRREVDVNLIYQATKIDCFFLDKFVNIVNMEKALKADPLNLELFKKAKRMGFSDKFIGSLCGKNQLDIYRFRKENNIYPVYKMIDTCAGSIPSNVHYYYSTYENQNDSIVSDRKKVIVLGSGPIRIGQGVEFDYSTVHAIWAIQEAGYEAIIINNNPETVSTDYTTK